MINEFSRTRMLLGAENMQKIEGSHVAVFGAGGVGSHAIEALARCGVGRLTIVDNDHVSLTNINRQSIALHSTLGQYKTQAMRQRILDINPRAQVFTYEVFLLPENMHQLFDQIGPLDYIVDAIDTVSAKLALAEYAQDSHTPIIASMGTGNKLHPELFQISDIYDTSVCPLCRVMRKELKARGIRKLQVCWSAESPIKPEPPQDEDVQNRRGLPGSISFVPPAAGLQIAGAVIRDLCGLSSSDSAPAQNRLRKE